MYGHAPSYAHLQSFGCLSHATVPLPLRDKLKSRVIPSIFLGYAFGKKAYKFLNLKSNSIFYYRDVSFVEHIFLPPLLLHNFFLLRRPLLLTIMIFHPFLLLFLLLFPLHLHHIHEGLLDRSLLLLTFAIIFVILFLPLSPFSTLKHVYRKLYFIIKLRPILLGIMPCYRNSQPLRQIEHGIS